MRPQLVSQVQSMVGDSLVVFRTAERMCAIPRHGVLEVMRPMPVEPLKDTPDFVAGVSLIRGAATPVIDLGVVVMGDRLKEAKRLITMRSDGDRPIALLVSEVLGLYSEDRLRLEDAPPLLRDTDQSRLSALGRLDEALLTVLRLGRLVPEAVWRSVEERPA